VKKYVPMGMQDRLFQAVGCGECAMTSYRGRFAILEILVMTPELERLISKGATADQIASTARAGGMKPLFESGLRHVIQGETSIDELLRVTEPPREDDLEERTAPPAGGSRREAKGAAGRSPDDGSPAIHVTVAAPTAPPAAGKSVPMLEFSPAFELLDDLPPPKAELTRKGALVLLVDDEDQLRRVMRDLLERQGYTVVEARDGAEALDEVDRHGPDIVILDLNLPGVDGYSVLSQLRSRTSTRQLPIIVLTAKGDEDNEVRVLELGADDFLTKPFRAKALAARLENVLSRRSN
jgi:CheY-like chemotaxis protein